MKEPPSGEYEIPIGLDASKRQLLKYAQDIARLYGIERTQREELEITIKQLEHEIAERERLQESLAESEARYRSLFEESVEAIYITSREGQVLDANNACLKLLGYRRKELVGANILTVYADPEIRPVFRRQIEDTGLVKEFALQMRRKDGKIIDCLITGTLRKGRRGKILGYQGIIRDVTEQQRARKILELAGRMEALAHMAGGIAHEIKNPLAISSSAAQILENDNIPRYLREECSQKIVTGINRAAAIIENLLSFAMPLNRNSATEIDLIPLLSEAIDRSRSTVAGQHVELIYQCRPQRCPMVGSVEMLNRLFLNLISNALSAMPHGGVLSIEVEARDAEVMITVTDTGTGMQKDQIPRAFDPFFTGFSQVGGVGLGLSVAYSVVAQHGGTIEVKSAEGQGTSFFVKLPANPRCTEQART